jgi:hypothetical protein
MDSSTLLATETLPTDTIVTLDGTELDEATIAEVVEKD